MTNLLSRKENTELNEKIEFITNRYGQYEYVFLKDAGSGWVDKITETTTYKKAEKTSQFTGLWARHGAHEVIMRACDVIAALKEIKTTYGRSARKAARAAK